MLPTTMKVLEYLDAVAIPRAIGSRNPSLSSTVCAKLAPTSPVTTTTAAVRDVLAPEMKKKEAVVRILNHIGM